MITKINGNQVDVKDEKCATRSCFYLLSDKGTFVQGRGYTSYHEKPKWVCGRRHLHGCPSAAVCKQCRAGLVEWEKFCWHCKGTDIETLNPRVES